jgi:hypothetical protein
MQNRCVFRYARTFRSASIDRDLGAWSGARRPDRGPTSGSCRVELRRVGLTRKQAKTASEPVDSKIAADSRSAAAAATNKEPARANVAHSRPGPHRDL